MRVTKGGWSRYNAHAYYVYFVYFPQFMYFRSQSLVALTSLLWYATSYECAARGDHRGGRGIGLELKLTHVVVVFLLPLLFKHFEVIAGSYGEEHTGLLYQHKGPLNVMKI